VNEGKPIVVCGAGDWVRKQYAPVLKSLSEARGCPIWIAYDSAYIDRWPQLPAPARSEYRRVINANVAAFRSSGLHCLDVAATQDRYTLASLAPSAVFVVAPPELHCRISSDWLTRADTIVIEKPFETDVTAVERMARRLGDESLQVDVLAFDHYLARAEPLKALWRSGWLADFLEGRIRQWTFEMIESSKDEEFIARLPSLQAGMVLDLCSHGAALLSVVGDPATIELATVKAGVYRSNPPLGVTTSARQLMPDGMETFAEATFKFASAFGEEANGRIRVGKFVDRPTKSLVIVGGKSGDRVVRVDFLDGRFSCSRDGADTVAGALPRDGVAAMIRAVVDNDAHSSEGLTGVDDALGVMVALTRIHEPIATRVKNGRRLAEYVAGTSAEQICAELDYLYRAN
jgi:predicted dehydrogenase